MHINRNNYEAFFLDYWENKLCPEAKNELARFLEANSDLQDEFLDFRDSFDIQLPNDDKIEFAGKSKLKKIEIAATQNVDENN